MELNPVYSFQFDFQWLIVLLVMLIAIVVFIIIFKKSKNNQVEQKNDLSKKDEIFSVISLVLNGIWYVLIIPVILISFMAGVETIMMTDSGDLSAFKRSVVFVCTMVFWAIPILSIVSIVFSFFLRKMRKYVLSTVIQLFPFLCAGIAFSGVLFLTNIK